MKLKRVIDANGRITHVDIRRAGPMQKFSPRLVDMAVMEGWMSLDKNSIIIRSKPKDMSYSIHRYPGVYCCHCGIQLPDGAPKAVEHIQTVHPGVPSPDSFNPAGYRYDSFYECKKEV